MCVNVSIVACPDYGPQTAKAALEDVYKRQGLWRGKARILKGLSVIEEYLRVRVEREGVVAAVHLAGAHGAGQESRGDITEIGNLLVQRYEDVHCLKLRYPGYVQPRHVGQGVGVRAYQDLVVQVRPLVRDGVDLVLGMLLLELGDEHIHKGFILRGLGAVMVPEVDDSRLSGVRAASGRLAGLRG